MAHLVFTRCLRGAALGFILLVFPPPLCLAQGAWPHVVVQSGRGLGKATAFSPDGKMLATGDQAGIVLIDVANGREKAFWKGVKGYPNQLAFSPDGRWLASAGAFVGWIDGTANVVQVWDVAAGREVKALVRHRVPVVGVAFTPDGRSLISVGENATTIEWDWRNGRIVKIASHPKGEMVGAVSLSADGCALVEASGKPDRKGWAYSELQVYEAMTTRVLRSLDGFPFGMEPKVGFSPDGRWLAVGSRVVDLSGPPAVDTPLAGADFEGEVLALTASGLAVVGRDDRGFEIWNVATHKRLEVVGSQTPVSATFSPDARRLAVRVGSHGVRLYDVATMKVLSEVVSPAVPQSMARGISGPLPIAEYSPDGRELAVADINGDVELWQTDRWERTAVLHSACIGTSALRYGPRGHRLASFCAPAQSLQLWNVAGRAVVGTFKNAGPNFDFTPDGTQVAWIEGSLGATVVTFADLSSGAVVRSLPLATDAIRLTADGKRIVGLLVEKDASDGAYALRVAAWDAQTGARIWDYPWGGPFAVSPDGCSVAVAGHVYDTATGRDLRTFTTREGIVEAITFSPDGRFLAASYMRLTSPSDDVNAIIIWETSGWREVALLKGHEAPVGHLVFSPDGEQLVSVSHDYTVRAWSLSSLTQKQRRP